MVVANLPLTLLLVALGGAAPSTTPPMPAAPATGVPVLLWLGPFEAAALDGRALIEAVAVYTRDLNLETRTAADVPLPSPAARAAWRDAAAAAALRAHGARLGFWCEPSADGRTITLLTVDTDGKLEARLVESAGLGGPELNRAIALKLRAVLAATIGPDVVAVDKRTEAAPPAPAPPTPPPSTPPPTTTREAATNASATASLVAPAPAVTSPGPSAIAAGRFFGALGYRLSLPLGAGGFQQGIAGELGARLGRAAELALGLAIENHVTDGADGESTSVFDLPVAIEARWVRRRARLAWGAGGFAALHLLWASASAPDMAQSAFDIGGSVGAVALVRGALGGGVAAEARLYAELAVPATTYWVGQTRTVELGSRVGLGLSLFFPTF
jgi:hypothetical protein